MSETSTLVSQCFIKIDGALVSEELMRALFEVVIDNSLHMPDVATIVLNDPELKWIDDPMLAPGKTVEIETSATPVRSKAGGVFDGEIVEVEPEFGAQTHRLTIRAFDRLHRLSRGLRVRSFQNVTDSDIAQRMAGEAGLQADVIATRQVHPYVFQNNQSNLEFLRGRASAVGYLLYVEGKKLCFKPLEQAPAPVELSWGATLSDFRVRMTTLSQASTITTRGWDPRSRKEIVSEVTSGKGMRDVGENKQGGDVAKEAFRLEAAVLVANAPIRDQLGADQLARAVVDRQAERFIEAEGTCAGNPAIIAGASVSVDCVGKRFSGTYFVTASTHRFSAKEGYATQFVISGQTPVTLLRLLQPDGPAPSNTGLVIGIVTDNQDPEGWGRVKVKYPWLSAEHASDWARVVSVGAGATRGVEFLPEVDDEVLVGFEMGDVHHPYVIGGLWNGQDAPPKTNQEIVTGGRVQQRIVRSRTGHQIVLDDSDGKSGVIIADKNGNSIEFSSTANALAIDVKGDLTIKAGGQVTIKGALINLN
jgi:phage protein D